MNNWRIIIIITIFVTVLALLYVWQRSATVALGYETLTLKEHRDKIQNEIKILQIELAGLKSLERIERIARDELKLISPERFEFVAYEALPGN